MTANIWKDLQYTLRVLRLKPAFTLAAIAVLALGIGANTAMFTVINATLLQPLPYADPSRLVNLYESRVLGDSVYNVVSPPNFSDWKSQAKSFTQMAAYGDASFGLSGNDGRLPERIRGVICTYNLFSTLGVQPALGRAFLPEEDAPTATRVLIISHGLWQRHFGGSAGIIGQLVRLDGENYTVVGVMPAWFQFPDSKMQAWAPFYRQVPPQQLQSRGNHRMQVVARLRPGVSVEQAKAELDGIAKRIYREHPNDLTGKDANVVLMKERTVAGVRTMLLVLLGAVGLVLLIACVNVTNLFLARAVGRRREAAIRIALGASRSRLVRQFLMESVVIALAGGAAGVFLAASGTTLLTRMASNLPRSEAIHVDGWVLLFTVAVSLLTGVFSGLAPAFSTSNDSLAAEIHEGGRANTGGKGTNRLRETLVAGEVALSLMLLIGAGLLLKSFERLRTVDPGFSAPRALTMGLSLPKAQYPDAAQRVAFWESLVSRVKALPGVEAAGIASTLPLNGHFSDNTFDIVGRPPLPPGQYLDALFRGADPGYFQAMGIPLKRGRVFTASDRLGNAKKIVISESMAKQFFRGEDPIGQKIRNGSIYEIVGVVGDVRIGLANEMEPTMYVPILEGIFSFGSLVVRTSTDPDSLALPIEREIGRLNADLPVSDVLNTDEIVSTAGKSTRFAVTLLMVFAGIAAILAAVGLYGVLAYTIGQRTNELGIRMALGATAGDMMRLAFWQGLRPTAIGASVGLAAAFAATRVMRSLLFHVSSSDPQVFVLVTFLLAVIAIAASLGPAVRAARIDPAVALRRE
ncbi:MAG TPA: ABC transporter permease [Bryobacteraceae bacterium]|nr:ABC transporter permease [Bryobacteraceae bacterium]